MCSPNVLTSPSRRKKGEEFRVSSGKEVKMDAQDSFDTETGSLVKG